MMHTTNSSTVPGDRRPGQLHLSSCVRAWVFRAATALLLAIALPHLMHGQLENSGQVLGTVKDPKGNNVTGASVTLKSVDTGFTITQATNPRGEYLFPAVGVGNYSLTAVAPGFAVTTEEGVRVDANQNVSLDLLLRVAGSEVSVEVNAVENHVDTQSATVGLLLDHELVQNLPVDGNNIVAMSALLPGVSNVNAPTTFTSDTSGPSYNVNGSRSTQNLFQLDGSIWNNLYTNSGLNFPNPNALQEVSVLLNNFKAQYGRNAGSVFNALTRSGSNSLHGVIYEYAQNSAFNASDYMLHTNPKLIQNQFGATVGGPILRDRLFFFLSYQGLRVAQTNTTLANFGFSLADRGLTSTGGAVPCSPQSAFVGLNCFNMYDQSPVASTAPYAPTHNLDEMMYNPLTATNTNSSPLIAISALNSTWQVLGHSGNSPCVNDLEALPAKYAQYLPTPELPTDCINPVMANILQTYVPLPNSPNAIPTAMANTLTSSPFPRAEENGLARVDWNFHSHSINARYYTTRANDFVALSNSSLATYERDHESGETQFGEIGDTWVLTPNLLNVPRLAYKRYAYFYTPTVNTTLADLGSDFAQYNSVGVLPALPHLGTASQAVSSTINEDIEASDTLSWTKGYHNLQFGVDILRLQYANVAETAPSFAFGGYSSISQADELMGLISSENFGNQLNRAGIQHDYYFYVQDDWRVSPRLTLNLGVRYELPLRYFQPKNQDTTFIAGYQSVLFPGAVPDLAFVGDPGVPRALIKNEYTDIAPRFGFAYDIFGNGRMSLRGGGGMFYEATNALTIGVGEPYHFQATYAYPSGSISEPLLGLNPVPLNFNGKNASFQTPYSIFYPDPNYRGASTYAFNLGIERAFGKSGVLSANYILRLGRHQALPLDQNPAVFDCSGAYFSLNPALYCPSSGQTQPQSYQRRVRYPGFNYGGAGVVDYMSIGTSNYNGFQLLYSQRATRGVTVTSSFSYAKSLDEFSSSTTTSSSVPQIGNLSSEYGPSDFDARLTVSVGWTFKPTKVDFGPRAVRMLLSGWTQTGTYSARTGQPFSVLLSPDYAYTAEPHQRAQQVPGTSWKLPSNRHRTQKVQEWFNANYCLSGVTPGCVWTIPQPGTYGNESRNMLYGPAYIVANLGVGRIFPVHEGINLNFRTDAFNAFNTPNLANPGATEPSSTTNSSFGVITQTAGTNATVGGNGRRLQLSLKLTY